MDASIIIPTYNRTKSLLRTISSAVNLDYPKDKYEIIVVDNASNTATVKTIKELLRRLKKKVNLRYVRENQLGVHFARHRGAYLAKSDILVFTDDDATFDSRWLKAYLEAFKEYPEMVAAGGPVRPVWQSPPQKWLTDFIGKSKTFFILSLMEPYTKFHLEKKGFFFSINMAIRREVLSQMGGFNPELVGGDYVGNGEAGLNQKLWKNKLLIGYIPEALVYHHIPSERMTREYFMKRMTNEGASDMYGYFQNHFPGFFHLISKIIRTIIRNLVWFVLAIFVGGRSDYYSLVIQMEKARGISQIKYMIRLARDEKFRNLVLKKDWLR